VTQFSIRQAKRHFPQLIQQALAGADVIIAKAGQPAVRVVPIAAKSNQGLPDQCAAGTPSAGDDAPTQIE